jgi:hypothetical protein
MTKVETKEPILKDLYQLCYSAHFHTSFSPERRAKDYVNEYSTMLENDLILLGDNQGNYKEKFISKFSEWMSAKGRCISSMITGGSNFPVRRAEKANASERNKCNAFYHWREKYFTAVSRVPTKSPEDDLEIAERRLETLVNYQIECKQINVAIRKSKIKDSKDLVTHLISEYDFDLEKLKRIASYGDKHAIPSYE